MTNSINLKDNTTLKDRADKFTIMEVDLEKIVADWKKSVFSFEWLLPNGQVKTPNELNETGIEKYNIVKDAYQKGDVLERPILGLGVMDNVEIGSRKEVLLTLYSLGEHKMDVHVPKDCLKDFQEFM